MRAKVQDATHGTRNSTIQAQDNAQYLSWDKVLQTEHFVCRTLARPKSSSLCQLVLFFTQWALRVTRAARWLQRMPRQFLGAARVLPVTMTSLVRLVKRAWRDAEAWVSKVRTERAESDGQRIKPPLVILDPLRFVSTGEMAQGDVDADSLHWCQRVRWPQSKARQSV